MDLTWVEWRGGMSCGGSSSEVEVGDPSLKLGSSLSTCSSSICSFEVDLGETQKYLVVGYRSLMEDREHL